MWESSSNTGGGGGSCSAWTSYRSVTCFQTNGVAVAPGTNNGAALVTRGLALGLCCCSVLCSNSLTNLTGHVVHHVAGHVVHHVTGHVVLHVTGHVVAQTKAAFEPPMVRRPLHVRESHSWP